MVISQNTNILRDSLFHKSYSNNILYFAIRKFQKDTAIYLSDKHGLKYTFSDISNIMNYIPSKNYSDFYLFLKETKNHILSENDFKKDILSETIDIFTKMCFRKNNISSLEKLYLTAGIKINWNEILEEYKKNRFMALTQQNPDVIRALRELEINCVLEN